MKKRIFSLLLAAVTMLGAVPGFSLIPSAEAATETVILDNNCTSLPDSTTGIKGNYPGYYFADVSNKNGISVPSGTILMGADGSAEQSHSLNYSIASFPYPSFNLKINMKIESLMTPASSPAWCGLRLEVTNPGNPQLSVGINNLAETPSSDGTNADFYIFKALRSSSSALHCRITVPTDGAFHEWEFQHDGVNEVRVLIDGKLAASFTGITLTAATETENADGTTTAVLPSLRIGNAMSYRSHGVNKVVFDNIELTSGITMYSVEASAAPDSSADRFTLNTKLENLAPVSFTITSKDDPSKVYTHTYMPTALVSSVTVTDIPFTGLCTVDVNAGPGVEDSFECYLYANLKTVSPNRTITSDGSLTAYKFERLHNADFANQSAWTVEYFRNGDNAFGSVVSCGAVSNYETFTVPVTLNGKFAVYVGYLEGTKNFTVNSREVFVTSNTVAKTNTVYERFAIAGDFYNEKIVISNTAGAPCRLVYVKFVSITDEMYYTYVTQNPSQHLMMDNDGFSMLTGTNYNYAGHITQNYVDRYALPINLGQYNFAAWVTGMLNYPSEVMRAHLNEWFGEKLGLAEGTEWMSEEAWKTNFVNLYDANGNVIDPAVAYVDTFRALDGRYLNNILNLNQNWGIPHEIVADYVAENGYGETYASLRMSAYYADGSTGEYANGTIYQLHTEWVRGGGYQLSYYYEGYRNYIHDVLIEMASSQNVAGVTMDFGRYPYIFGTECPDVADRTSIMNEFVASVRADLNQMGKKLNVRVLTPTGAKAEAYGLDYKTWVKNGWVDRVIISESGHETFFDVTQYAEFFSNPTNNPHGVEFYVGIVATLTGHDKTLDEEIAGAQAETHTYVSLEQFLLRAHEAYEAGADGIFLFNTINTLYKELGTPTPTYAYMNNSDEIEKWYTFEYPAYSVSDTVETFVKSWEVPTGFKRLTVRKPPRLRFLPLPA